MKRKEPSKLLNEKVLGCLLGLSPQVLTETVWALAINRQPNWTPDRIEVFTTQEGRAAFDQMLVLSAGSPLTKLGMKFGRRDVEVLATRISFDIFQAGDGTAMNEAIFAFVQRLTDNSLSQVHLSVAGGRKSTAVVAGLAMSLCGRTQDSMSHVVASEKIVRQGANYVPSGEDLYDLPHLIDLPFPKLGHLVDVGLDRSDWLTAVGRVQSKLSPMQLRINLSLPALRVGSEIIRLQPIQAAMLLYLMSDGSGARAQIPRSGFLSRKLKAAYVRVGRQRSMPLWPEVMPPERVQEQIARINKLVLTRQNTVSHAKLIILGEGRPNTTYVLNVEHYELELE